MTALWADESGFLITAELVLVGTIVVLGLTAALVGVRDAIGGELVEVANAFRNLDQSYYFSGMRSYGRCGVKAWTAGSFHGCRPGGMAVIETQPEIYCPETAPCPPQAPLCPPETALPCPPQAAPPCPPAALPPCPPEVSAPCPPLMLPSREPSAQPLVW